MKKTFLLLLVPLMATCLFAKDHSWQQSDDVFTKDVGIPNYTFEMTPAKGSVVVLRATTTTGDAVTSITGVAAYSGGLPVKGIVIYFDPATFAFAGQVASPMSQFKKVGIKMGLTILSQDGSQKGSINGSSTTSLLLTVPGSTGYASGPDGVEFSSTDDKGVTTRIQYTAKIEDYEILKKEHVNLPAMLSGAKWVSPLQWPLK